ncbi:MAG: hypothetical protein AMXMBFR58_35320 [Phycisphaerae bacterium]
MDARPLRRGWKVWILGAVAAVISGCVATNSPDYENQRTFTSPDEAVHALAEAAQAGDTGTLTSIFGTQADAILSSGDAVADLRNRETFSVAMNDRWSLRRIDSETRELLIGHDEWPFPVPVVKDARGWWFNTLAGRDEVLARRIGRNELAAIGALHTYVEAQHEYAAQPRDGLPAGVYAQQFRSDPGRHNGLFWETSPGQPPSPLATFAASAQKQGYAGGSASVPGPRTYHGYTFRILTRQGAAAPGGARDYISSGAMTGGFALVAWPVTYRNTGVMTFMVGPDGTVYERDLGPQTAAAAAAIAEFNPGEGWIKSP